MGLQRFLCITLQNVSVLIYGSECLQLLRKEFKYQTESFIPLNPILEFSFHILVFSLSVFFVLKYNM